jgi:hypothetical protein
MAKFCTTYEDDGGTRRKTVSEGVYHFIRWDEFPEEEWEEYAKYVVVLCEVNLHEVGESQILDSLSSWGFDSVAEFAEEMPPSIVFQELAEVLRSYGARTHLQEETGNNLSKLMKSARAESTRLCEDPVAHEEACTRVVNAIGSTAREYGQGDISSALHRGFASGNAESILMAKLYGGIDMPHKGVEHLQKNPHGPDGLARMCGVNDAIAGKGHAAPVEDLAPAYLEGYAEGVRVKSMIRVEVTHV